MSARTSKAAGAAYRGYGENEARAAKARRTAWALAGLAAFFYFGYIAWMFVASGGG